jgi:hypothetical protein
VGERPLSGRHLSRSFDPAKQAEEDEQMHPYLISVVAKERTQDMQSRAARSRLARTASGRQSRREAHVSIRDASPADAKELRRVAQLDSNEVPPAPLLIAEVDGRIWSAVSLSDGSVIADPFHPTAELIALLRRHATRPHRSWRRFRTLGRSRWSAPTPAGPASA